MQTFLPFDDLRLSIQSLDNRRLGKQRVEAYQILRTLAGTSKGWSNHPAVRMWRGYEPALTQYMNLCILEWQSRGFRNTMALGFVPTFNLPPWFGSSEFHRSHQSNLLRKDPIFYGPKFPGVPSDLPYVWPV